ncbi:hypothetical protein ABH924_004933 [Arthrobacter sp. GAS37]|uniref:hypothetical protein n=1 Tax=Arthrobacter sp. GAS37 TaxID=3156261 RepID=UPI003835CC7C
MNHITIASLPFNLASPDPVDAQILIMALVLVIIWACAAVSFVVMLLLLPPLGIAIRLVRFSRLSHRAAIPALLPGSAGAQPSAKRAHSMHIRRAPRRIQTSRH